MQGRERVARKNRQKYVHWMNGAEILCSNFLLYTAVSISWDGFCCSKVYYCIILSSNLIPFKCRQSLFVTIYIHHKAHKSYYSLNLNHEGTNRNETNRNECNIRYEMNDTHHQQLNGKWQSGWEEIKVAFYRTKWKKNEENKSDEDDKRPLQQMYTRYIAQW